MADPSKFSIAKLGNNNYGTWRFQMEMFLTREELWHVIAEQAPVPVTEAWNRADKKAKATIGLCIEQSQYTLIKSSTTAKEVWDALRTYHEKATITSQLSLLIRLCDTKLGESGNVEKHLLEMDALFERLEGAGLKLEEKLKIAMVLRSMPESYHFLVSALEARPDADITMELIKTKLLDEYRKRQERDGSSVAGEQALKTQKVTKDKLCFFCKKPGHFKRDCRKWQAVCKEPAGASGSGNKPPKTSQQQKAKQATDTHSGAICFSVTDVNEATCAAVKLGKRWTIDSGASCHMANNTDFFERLEDSPAVTVRMANGESTRAGGHGTGKVKMLNAAGAAVDIQLEEVLFVPQLESGLLSVSKITDSGYSVLFKRDCVAVLDESNEVVVQGERSGGLYVLKEEERTSLAVGQRHTLDCQHTWHRRFGHRDPAVLDRLQKEALVTGLKLVKCGATMVCECCLEGKMARLPYPQQSTRKTTQPLELIHTDLCGPMSNVTPGGNKYFLSLIDDYSRYIVVYLLKDKAEAKDCIKDFVRLVENKFGRKPKVIRSDRGGEFVNNDLKSFYRQEGIEMQLTAGYAPQQNGVAERRNRYLQEMAVCMLLDAKLDKRYWGEAIAAAAYVQNRLPSRAVGKTPYELWNGDKPDLGHLRVFGCEAFVFIPDAKRGKMQRKAEKLTFVGYACGSKAYRFLDRRTNRITISRDAKFMELGSKDQEESTKPVDKHQLTQEADDPERCTSRQERRMKKPFQKKMQDRKSVDEIEIDCSVRSDTMDSIDNEPEFEGLDETVYFEDEYSGMEELFRGTGQEQDEVRRSQRTNQGDLPARYEDFVVGVAQAAMTEPRSFREATSGPDKDKWIRAMNEEYESLMSKKTWSLVPLPPGRQVVGSKWVYQHKTDSSGRIVRFKARLVAQGYSQRPGIDFGEVFAPVAMQSTFRVLLTVAGHKHLQVRHIDVKNAYLNGQLKEEVFMRQPVGYEVPGREELVCKLHRSLYGLKQSANVWHSTVKEILLKLGFRQSRSDVCLYMKQLRSGEWMYILIYVDDMIVVCKENQDIERLEQELRKRFEISSLGIVNLFLGIKVRRDESGFYYLSQQAFIREIAERFGLQEAKTSKYPLDQGYLKQEESVPLPNNSMYHSLVGALLYLASNSRPDIAVAVSILSRKSNNPTQRDWTELKRVVRYLIGTAHYELKLTSDRSKRLTLSGYSDADWAGDASDRKSTSGFVFLVGDAVVSWASRKQGCVATSTMEAEYVALSEAASEAVWLRGLLSELGVESQQATTIFEDNRSCMDFVSLDKQSKRSKHIDTKRHHAKDLCSRGIIQLTYCPTDRMMADVFTKPLGPSKMFQFAKQLGLVQ